MAIRFNVSGKANPLEDCVSRKIASAASSGTIFMGQVTGTPDSDYAELATDDAAWVLVNDVTSDGPSVYEKAFSLLQYEDKVDMMTRMMPIRKNMMLEKLETYGTSITALTAEGSDLYVTAGLLETSGTTVVAKLDRNDVETNSVIDVRFI
jgi:hypothetical protein